MQNRWNLFRGTVKLKRKEKGFLQMMQMQINEAKAAADHIFCDKQWEHR